MKYFEKCTDCDPSLGTGQRCAYSSYILMDYHDIDYSFGCSADATPDDNEGGYTFAYNFISDNYDCTPKFESIVGYNCYWSCKKN